MKVKHILAALAGLFLSNGLFAASVGEKALMAEFKLMAYQSLANSTIDGLKTGLHVGFCGTGSPMPDLKRAGPCTAVIAGGQLFVFDAGEGSAEKLNFMGLPPERVRAVFLTHFHSDHIDGLGALGLQRWAGSGAKLPLPLYGPTGVKQIAAGFTQAYGLDKGYRVEHHGAEIMPPSGFGFDVQSFAPPAFGTEAVVYDQEGVKIITFSVNHDPIEPALGYRIEYGGQKIVISGDTKKCDCVTKAAKGANLLVHEALSQTLTESMSQAAKDAGQERLSMILTDILNYHTTPSEVAEIANTAQVGGVALTHITPPLPSKALEVVFLDDAKKIFKGGPLWIMRDGDLVSLDAKGNLSKRNVIPANQ